VKGDNPSTRNATAGEDIRRRRGRPPEDIEGIRGRSQVSKKKKRGPQEATKKKVLSCLTGELKGGEGKKIFEKPVVSRDYGKMLTYELHEVQWQLGACMEIEKRTLNWEKGHKKKSTHEGALFVDRVGFPLEATKEEGGEGRWNRKPKKRGEEARKKEQISSDGLISSKHQSRKR